MSMLTNLCAIRLLINDPTIVYATSLIDLKGDIKITAPGALTLPTKVAILHPIDLPMRTISLYYMPIS